MLAATVAAMCSGSISAQKVNLPEKGTFSTEVMFNPLGGDFEHFKLNEEYGLKFRYFLSDRDALRVGLGLNVDNVDNVEPITKPQDNATQYETDFYNYKNDNNKDITKTGAFGINLGYERHFMKTGRIDLYAGGELGFVLAWVKKDEVESFSTTTANNSYINQNNPSTYTFYTKETEIKGAGGYAFRVGAFTGIDFYIYKGLYVGTELGLRMLHTSYKDHETTFTNNDPRLPIDKRTQADGVANNQHDFSLKFHVEPAIRLGWSF